MKFKLFALTATAAAALLATGAHAQTNDQLKDALAQAQAAAAQAQAAARQAQETLDKVLAAMSKQAAMAAPAAPSAGVDPKGSGFTFTNGPNSLSIYGLIDVTASNKNNANAALAGVTGLQTAWFSGNRIGFSGKRELGDGLKAVFRLESEFDYRTGAEDTAGVLFNRDAWLGVESDTLGKISVGRQNALGRDFAAGYLDPYGAAKSSTAEGGGTNTNNFKQLIFYAGSATGTRYDNGIVWKKDFKNGLVGGLGYQFGNVAGNSSKGTTKSAALGYNAGPLNVAGFVQSANVADLTHSSFSIGGNYSFDIVRINAGYFNYKADQKAGFGQRKDSAYTLSAKFSPKGKLDYTVGYQTMRANNAGIAGAGATADVLAAYADTSAITATATGNRNTIYGGVMYHFDEATEMYVVADKLNLTGGYRVKGANGATSQNEFGIGMRFKF